MITIDYLSDLGLKGSSKKSSNSDTFNIVVNYTIDDTSAEIVSGDLLTFVANNIKKVVDLDVVNAISLDHGVIGETIRCQLFGIVNIPNSFIAGKYYYNNAGVLTDVENDKCLGLAITKDELLLREGVFINA